MSRNSEITIMSVEYVIVKVAYSKANDSLFDVSLLSRLHGWIVPTCCGEEFVSRRVVI